MTLSTIFKNALRPAYLKVMLQKIGTRLREPGIQRQKKQATEWAKKKAVPLSIVLKTVDEELFQSSQAFYANLQAYGKAIEQDLPVKMGAGGNCFLLYFLCKKYPPQVVVETGVSMGYSSQTILKAMQEQGEGHLFSSDFPYFRLENPEKYIGCVVEEKLKDRWTLLIEGDRVNLPKFMKRIKQIDLFHFDSDKSVSGRTYAWGVVKGQISPRANVVFDDIRDNFHFKSLMAEEDLPCLVVYDDVFGGYVGIMGRLVREFQDKQ